MPSNKSKKDTAQKPALFCALVPLGARLYFLSNSFAEEEQTCPVCKGEGKLTSVRLEGSNKRYTIRCPECNGSAPRLRQAIKVVSSFVVDCVRFEKKKVTYYDDCGDVFTRAQVYVNKQDAEDAAKRFNSRQKKTKVVNLF